MNIHTYRTLGYLVAMLLARSLDRSERIAAAMKCRGFSGKFYVVDHFSAKQIDAVFGVASFGILLCLTVIEWL
jgi:cobalt/nickel transport system permease protein